MHPENPKYSAETTVSKDSKHFESGSCRMGHPPGQSRTGGTALLPAPKLRQAGNALSTFIFYLSILFFIIGFNFSDVMVGNWYQQWMPDLGNNRISDITFVDSLVGYAVTRTNSGYGTNYILKTTSGGNVWDTIQSFNNSNIIRVAFLNNDTGYVCVNIISASSLFKTINGGLNWLQIAVPEGGLYDMFVLNTDTIWISDQLFTGRLFITTNGGASWQLQYTNNNGIDKIYMYNRNIGFLSCSSSLFKQQTADLTGHKYREKVDFWIFTLLIA